MKRKKVLKTAVTNESYADVLAQIIEMARNQTPGYVCITNVHMVIESFFSSHLEKVIEQAEIVTPDGRPVAVAMNLLYGTQQEQIAGPDLMIDLFKEAHQNTLSLYFYGSAQEVLDALKIKLSDEYPGIKIAGLKSPPFRPLSPEEIRDDIHDMNASGAQLLLVALGCPKQEQWMFDHRHEIRAVMVGLGAAFPFYTGHLKRAPLWMQKCCLEWLFRLAMEPRRLFRRYFITNSLFILLLLKQLFFVRLLGRKS